MAQERSEFRADLRRAMREQMVTALDAGWIQEANILLDAVVLLDRGPGGDLDAKITAEERLASSE